MRSLIPFEGLFGDTVLDHFFDDMPTIYEDYVSVPKVDVEDCKDHYEVTCDMPGFTKDQVHVSYEHGVLSISAKKDSQNETKDSDRHYLRKERGTAQFARQFSVRGIDEKDIKASMKDGVLTVDLPKMKEAKVEQEHRIQIE